MREYSFNQPNQPGFNVKSLELHHVLRQYREFEREKSVLKNRITVMVNNQSRNVKKAKVIEEQLDKILKVKKQRLGELQVLNETYSKEKQKQIECKRRNVQKVKQIEERANASKVVYSEHKEERGKLIRSERKTNYKKIVRKKEETMRERKEKRSRVRETEEFSKLKIESFHGQKLKTLRMEAAQSVAKQKRLNRTSENEVVELKELEKSVLMKYSESVASLHMSRKKARHLRA